MAGLLTSTRALVEQLGAFAGGREGIALPFQFIFSGEDGLRLFVSNVVPNLTVRVSARWLESGSQEVQALTYDYAVNATGEDNFFHIPLGRGVLLNVVVLPLTQIVARGQCYVRIDVERGQNAHVLIGTLLAGYIDSSGGRAWPGSPLESSVEGPGYVHRVAGAVPAAGADAFVTMPVLSRWKVRSAQGVLVASAAVVTRYALLFVTQDSDFACMSVSNRPTVAGEGIRHIFGAGGSVADTMNVSIGLGPLPADLTLQTKAAASSILTLALKNADPADQLTALHVLVEEWRNPVTVES